ncbi:MAG: hypothetical protein R3E66_03390 [bacterium]
MTSIPKTRWVLVALMMWVLGTGCSDAADKDKTATNNSTTGGADAGTDAVNDTSLQEDAGVDMPPPTAEKCEAQVDETACTQLGCLYSNGFRATATDGEACSYEGPAGFCVFTNSRTNSNVVATYVREIDVTQDEVMMLPSLIDGMQGGWLSCWDDAAADRPGCVCDYSEASNL